MINFLKQKGSVAIMSVLLISAVILILVVATSESKISSSLHQININANKIVYYSAETCLEETLIRLKEDLSFSSSSVVFEDGHFCSSSVDGGTILIGVVYFGYNKNFMGEFNATQNGEVNYITLSNWTEI